ncbi:MAG: glycoside hydrolase family 78 protein [Lentisphaeria bacterium]|nr:glycoside hydrolase family 78 protein [Lentisphaeria bacterium]
MVENRETSSQSDSVVWQAKWISSTPPFIEPRKTPPGPLLRKEFQLQELPETAKCHLCGLGFHELYINGVLVGDHVLDPAFTAYDKRVLYVTHDISAYLRKGTNCIGVMLGNGWYNCQTDDAWNFAQASWRGLPKLLCQLDMRFADGHDAVIVSDSHWKAHDGPVIFSDLRQGETFDARLEQKGWNTAGYDDSDWTETHITAGPGGVLLPQTCPPIRCHQAVKPVAMFPAPDGGVIYDLGRSISGWAQLRVAGPPGTEVTITYGELLTEDGRLDQRNLDDLTDSERFQRDIYILKGEPVEIWSPRFVYHGFRYMRVTGLPGLPSLEHIRGVIVHTDLSRRGSFQCSKPLFNSIHDCVINSTLFNYHGFPTDCPHREKNGWTGDAHLSAEQALFNFDMTAAYKKWLDDLADSQRPSGQLAAIVPTGGWGYNFGSGPAWDSAYPIILWHLYEFTGDTSILERHFASVSRYVDYLGTIADGRVIFSGLGDWCPPEKSPWGYECPAELTSTAYYFKSACLVSKMAGILGKKREMDMFSQIAGEVKEAFLERFFDSKTGLATSASQTAQACVVYQGFLDDDPIAKRKAVERLVKAVNDRDGHIWTGILGAKYVMDVLTRNGYADVAFTIASQTTFPGWGNWIRQGATTLWENWNGAASRMHHMFSDIGAWFYKALAGIRPDPDFPGFQRFFIEPHPVKGLDWARASHMSPRGEIISDWRREEDRVTYSFTIPPTAAAQVRLPGDENTPPQVLEGVTKSSPRWCHEHWELTLGAGTCQLSVTQPDH